MRILTVNAGSSSLKLRLLEEDDRLAGLRDLPVNSGEVDRTELADAISAMPAPDAIGHRIVHGGERFLGPVRIDAEVARALTELTDLAPLHQPKSLAALEAVSEAITDTPAVACFDTAFHATIPAAARTYALPEDWRRRWGLRRFGFHGLSHAYAARRAPEIIGRPVPRVVTCHLGAGASLAAVRDGHSLDTTMGFTPLEGLVMATRSGSVDPGMLLWLLERESVSGRELALALENQSGLLGLAGSSDMRTILDRSGSGDERAQLARDVYVHRLRAGIAAMVAALGGIDSLVFTGGVGENSPEVRALAVAGLDFLGAVLDPERNAEPSADRVISGEGSEVTVLLVVSREDLQIAAEVRQLLRSPAG